MTEPPEYQLNDGTLPADTSDLFARLDELGIAYDNLDHEPVYTVEEARALRGDLPGSHSKNFFLRDKKEAHWLVSVLSHRTVDLMWLAEQLGTKRLTFCSERRLMGFLGIRRGSVSPFAVINDTAGKVNVALDMEMLQQEPLNFHPLDNAKTTAISAEGLTRFLESVDHAPRILKFPYSEGPI